jgi:hypothetical protein
LVNAGKYLSKIIPPIVLLAFGSKSVSLESQHFWVYCSTNAFSTLFCLFWDFYMDWGMFRTTARGKYCLRDKITFKPVFYYYAMASNILFRFVWLVAIFKFQESQVQLLIFTLMMTEAVRRTQWAILRVENEFYNNFEAYRTYPTIPNLMDDVEITVELLK